MSTDRELLEFAAKACGYNTNHKWNRERLEMNPPVIGLVVHDGNDDLVSTGWNPLDSDGDALRLAVKLEIYFMVATEGGFVSARIRNGIRTGWHEDIRDDANSAARRAIVRAAAAIGETMP